MTKKYDELKHLLRCYFHQDMFEEHDNADEILEEYVLTNPEDSIKGVLNNIDELKKENLTLDQLDSYIDRLGCEYYYQDDMTGLEWLDYLSTTIKKYLAEKESIEQSEKNGM